MAPLLSKKIRKPAAPPTTTTTETPGLRDTPREAHKIAPNALRSFSEECMNTLLDTFEDNDTADEDRETCDGSISKLLTILHQSAQTISGADDSNIEARQDSLYKAGISSASVKQFNAFNPSTTTAHSIRRDALPNQIRNWPPTTSKWSAGSGSTSKDGSTPNSM